VLPSQKFWVEDVVSWDESVNLALSDYSLFSLLTLPLFTNTFIYIKSLTKLSFLDVTVMTENLEFSESQEFNNALLWDLCEMTQNFFPSSQFIYYTSYQDFSSLMVHHSPELVIPFLDFLTTNANTGVFKYILSIGAFFFNDTITTGVSKLGTIVMFLYLYVWFMAIFFHIFRLTRWGNALESYATRLFLYLYALARNNRLQFESAVLALALATFLTVFNLLSFKDLYEEPVEQLTLWLCYSFLGVYVFFIYKNSVHYLAFLEASITNRWVVSLFVQFGKDIANSVVLLLRFSALLVRLNIYDTLDDIMDSNYILVCDFLDDFFVLDSWAKFYTVLAFEFMYGVYRSTSGAYNSTYTFDAFVIHVIMCVKLLGFIFFIFEEVGRFLLAFFILYLIILEIQSINRSYSEDAYVTNKRK
jgi:hypothetical protein